MEYLTIPVGLVDLPNIVGSIANATLQQIMVSLFEKPPESREADVTRIFADLCASYRGQQTGYISFIPMNKNAILEVLESIFASDKSLFDKHPSLLKADILPILTDTIDDSRASFPTFTRVMRIASHLVPLSMDLLETLLQTLTGVEQWKQAQILETLKSCSSSVSAVAASQIITALSFFEDVLPGLGSYGTCTAPQTTDEQITSDGVVYTDTNELTNQDGLGIWCSPPRQLISLLNANQVPTIDSQYVTFLVAQLLIETSTKALDAWQGLLLMLSAFLSSNISLSLERDLLHTYLRVTVALDMADQKRPRDAFIRRIGRIAVSTSMVSVSRKPGSVEQIDTSTRDPSHRTFACLESFISIVEEVCQRLDDNAWRQIIEILTAGNILFSYEGQRRQSHSGSLISGVMHDERKTTRLPQFTAEMSRISSRVELLWRNSKELSSASFTALITSLCSPQMETPGSPIVNRTNDRITRARNGSIDSGVSFHHPMIFTDDNHGFVLQIVKTVVSWNMSRFIAVEPHPAWSPLMSFLRAEIQIGNTVAAETLGSIIQDAVRESLPSEEQQIRFLNATDLINGGDAMQAIQVQNLSVILGSVGHDLVCGWDIILDILHQSISSDSNVNLDTIRLGFTCLQMISTDFVGRLPEAQLPALIETITNYSAQTASINIALGATALLWNILDQLPSNADFSMVFRDLPAGLDSIKVEGIDDLWLFYLKHIHCLAVDKRSEIRNSILQICRRAILQAANLGPKAFLTSVHVTLGFLFTIPETLPKADTGTVETTNSIIMTARQVLQISNKVLKDDTSITDIWSTLR